MLLLLIFSFISGLFTILAPCIWPLLPIVLSTSASHPNRWRPLGVTIGITSSFAIFTLTISTLVSWLHIDANWFRYIAVMVLVFFGISLLAPKLNAWVESKLSRLSGYWGRRDQNLSEGFVGGLVTGLSLGIVWSPCAGPILATIATLAATDQVSSQVFLVTLTYVAGIGLPLFGFAYGGQHLVFHWKGLNQYTRQLQVFFGLTTIATALLIATNYDKTIEARLLNVFPQYADVLNQFENVKPVQQQLAKLKDTKAISTSASSALFNIQTPTKAPEFKGITQWLNSPPLTMAGLRGKVVLVDFWTYSCINCIRTLPYVTKWYGEYKDKGLVVIGVHTPEFEFEHDTGNVKRAIAQFQITYPVAQDNNFQTWKAFNNNFWPAEYLIDATGKIRRQDFGEGQYDQMEQAIQQLLKEAGQQVVNSINSVDTTTPTEATSPETYFGSDRMAYYTSGLLDDGTHSLSLNPSVALNTFSLGGRWLISDQSATAIKQAKMNYRFTGQHLYAVLSPGKNPTATATVLLDGRPVPATLSGADVKDGQLEVDRDRLYDLIDLHNHAGEHLVQINFGDGIQLYTLTFG